MFTTYYQLTNFIVMAANPATNFTTSQKNINCKSLEARFRLPIGLFARMRKLMKLKGIGERDLWLLAINKMLDDNKI